MFESLCITISINKKNQSYGWNKQKYYDDQYDDPHISQMPKQQVVTSTQPSNINGEILKRMK